MTATPRLALVLLVAAPLGAAPAAAASFADLSDGGSGSQYMGVGPYLRGGGPGSQFMGAGPYLSGPYASNPYSVGPIYGPGPYAPSPSYLGGPGFAAPQAYSGGPEGTPPPALDASGAATMAPMPASPEPYLPYAPNGHLPHGQLQLSTFGQVNSTTDPFNPWGLSTPYMFVPWSTPLSGWTNAQTWNWWRERSGALPRNW